MKYCESEFINSDNCDTVTLCKWFFAMKSLKKSWLGSRHSVVRLELIKAARRDARQRKLGYEVSSPVAGAVSVSCCRLSTSCSAWRLHWSDAVRRGSYLGRTKLGAGGGRP